MTTDRFARLGILMLDSQFPRIPGDVGNHLTWDFPVRYAVVPGATPAAIVEYDPAPFIDAFTEKGRELVAQGCTGIATTCGFLALIRRELAERLEVPVAASALEQSAQISATLPAGQTLGILTISATALTPDHLKVAGVPENAVIQGMEGTAFAATILSDQAELNISRAQDEIVFAAKALIDRAPETGAILLECTNMVPYARAVAAETGRPVYSIYSYLIWFHQSLLPKPFEQV